MCFSLSLPCGRGSRGGGRGSGCGRDSGGSKYDIAFVEVAALVVVEYERL